MKVKGQEGVKRQKVEDVVSERWAIVPVMVNNKILDYDANGQLPELFVAKCKTGKEQTQPKRITNDHVAEST